jgi:hypothetical protein
MGLWAGNAIVTITLIGNFDGYLSQSPPTFGGQGFNTNVGVQTCREQNLAA